MSTPGPIQCPHCHDGSSISCRGKKYALYPASCVVLMGLLLALLHQISAPAIYRCGKCRKDFGIRSTLARIFLIILITLALFAVASLAAALLR